MSIERRKTCICLCGGGITGAVYEIGALAALKEFGHEIDPEAADLYVGTSAGAAVASMLAAGIPIRRLYEAFLHDDGFLALTRHDIYRLDKAEVWDATKQLLYALWKWTRRRVKARLRRTRAEGWGRLTGALPSGVFSLDPYELWLRTFFERHGKPIRFRALPRPLYIAASDLDRGHRTLFGPDENSEVPIPRAIAASSAIPGFFEPVRIGQRDYVDGGAGKVAHLDVGIDRGAERVLVVNPLVPFNRDRALELHPHKKKSMRHIRQMGLWAVFDQAYRMTTKTRLHQGLRRYAVERPDVEVFLIEPDEADAATFGFNAMNFEVRATVARFGYESTLALLRSGRPLSRVLPKQPVHVPPRQKSTG